MKTPAAWMFEETEYANRAYEAGWKRRLSFEKPFDNDSGVRNIVALHPAESDILEALVVLENAAREPIDAGLLSHARTVARAAVAKARS